MGVGRRQVATTAVSVAIIAALCCASVSCGGDGEWQEPLRWKSSIDIPLNHSQKVARQIGDTLDTAHVDTSILLDLGTNDASTNTDVMNILKKMESLDVKYSIGITNGTVAGLTFYGMLFKDGDEAASMDMRDFYAIVRSTAAGNGDRINLLSSGGLLLESNDNITYKRDPLSKEERDLILGSNALAWRWLIKLNNIGFNSLKNDTTDCTDTVAIRLKINFSGVSSLDSLFSLF